MSMPLLSYLKNYIVIDNWGKYNIASPISLTGVILRTILVSMRQLITERDSFYTAMDSYFMTLNLGTFYHGLKEELLEAQEYYIKIVNGFKDIVPFYYQYLFNTNQIYLKTPIELAKEARERYAIKFQETQKQLAEQVELYSTRYKDNLNEYWRLRRLREQDIEMWNAYPPIQTESKQIAIITKNSGVQEYQIHDARIYADNEAYNYQLRLNAENYFYEVGLVANQSTPIPILFSYFPLDPRPVRQTIDQIEREIEYLHPPLPLRDLFPDEEWNIDYANTIKLHEQLYNDAIAKYQTLNCPQASGELHYKCEYYYNIQQLATENIRTLYVSNYHYPDDFRADLLPYPEFSMPTEKDLDRMSIDNYYDVCIQKNQYCYCVITQNQMIITYANKYGRTDTQENYDKKALILEEANLNIASCSNDPNFATKRNAWITHKNQFVANYGYEPTYSDL